MVCCPTANHFSDFFLRQKTAAWFGKLEAMQVVCNISLFLTLYHFPSASRFFSGCRLGFPPFSCNIQSSYKLAPISMLKTARVPAHFTGRHAMGTLPSSSLRQ